MPDNSARVIVDLAFAGSVRRSVIVSVSRNFFMILFTVPYLILTQLFTRNKDASSFVSSVIFLLCSAA